MIFTTVRTVETRPLGTEVEEGGPQQERRAVVVRGRWWAHDDVAGARVVLELDPLEDISLAVENEEFLEAGRDTSGMLIWPRSK